MQGEFRVEFPNQIICMIYEDVNSLLVINYILHQFADPQKGPIISVE